MVDDERLREGTRRQEKGGSILFLMLEVLGPLVAPNATGRPTDDLGAPRLVPVFVHRGPSAKVEARSSPEVTLWPPAVIPRIVGGTFGLSVNLPG